METIVQQQSSSVVLVFIRRGSIPTQTSFSSNRHQPSPKPAARPQPSLIETVLQILSVK